VRIRSLLPAALIAARLLAGPPPLPAQSQPEGDGPWMVRAWFGDDEMKREVASWGDHFAHDRKSGFLRLLADVERLDALRSLGFYVDLDEEGTALIRHAEAAAAEAAALAARGESIPFGIPGFPCYRTVEETFASAEAIVAAHPTLASWVDVGNSWDKANGAVPPGVDMPGYDMRVLKLTNSAVPGPKPKFMATSAIHAREYTTAELMTRFAEQLVAGHGLDADATWLLDDHEIHLLLLTNPDGRKYAENGQSWRKNTNQNYCGPTSSGRGADLNRNFSFGWGCCGGSSGSQCEETYRGPLAASEPETQSVQSYLQSIFPDQRAATYPGGAAPADATGVYLDVHSFSELVLWPWGQAPATDNAAAFRALGRRFAFFNGYTPQQAVQLYVTDGTTIDFAYGDLGVAGFVFELGTQFFQSCSTFESTILPDNLEALRYAAKVARTPYQTPSGPVSLDPAATPQAIAPGDPLAFTATIDDARFSTANGTEPTQAIAAAEAYLDVPPWDAGASPIPLAASDGAFNEVAEAVEGDIDTTGLASGRHALYVRGRDASNAWGIVSATFFYVVDPATAPTVEGVVREAGTNAPLAATVSVGPFETATDPGTGAYEIQVPPGTYDLRAGAPDHATVTVAGVELSALETFPQDFALTAVSTLYSFQGETGPQGWTTQSPWVLTTEEAHSPTHSWTDSPGGDYGDNVNTALTSPVLDLSAALSVELRFAHLRDFEEGYDYGHLEISTNGGSSWTEVVAWDDENLDVVWQEEAFDLPDLVGVPNARIRFRLTSDSFITGDGWHVDDIEIHSAMDADYVFSDNFETAGTTRWSDREP
jgi:hypothetical protein